MLPEVALPSAAGPLPVDSTTPIKSHVFQSRTEIHSGPAYISVIGRQGAGMSARAASAAR
jgi:hypothetical protein